MFCFVKSAIDNWDPFSLLSHHAPQDEYDYESTEIAAQINENSSEHEIAIVISNVLTERFYACPSISVENCLSVAHIIKYTIIHGIVY